MADECDRAQEQEEWQREAMIRSALTTPFIPGVPGDCDRCGEAMPRLVGGLCAPCRDGRNRFAMRRQPHDHL